MNSDRWAIPAHHQAIRIGDVTIHYVPDGFVELEPRRWYQQLHSPNGFPTTKAGYLVASVGAIVVEEPGATILIDLGLGPVREPANRTHPSLGEMVGGGLHPSLHDLAHKASAIATTHPHEDHVGWLKATSSPEVQVLRRLPIYAGSADAERLRQNIGVERVTGLRGGERISESMQALSTPGHTAGHLAYLVESGGQRALVLGDTFHSPHQLRDPEMTPWSDEQPEDAVRSRHVVLEILSTPDTCAVGYHFADVPFGSAWSGVWDPLP
jgi:glyoxylase-like metal-dependent hydrolase (beta-lactamase superfamily II)